MHRNTASPVVLAAALSACAAQPELLNSERIQQRFGSYGIEVLHQDLALRRSSLYSLEHGIPVTRTYAIVKFADPVHVELAESHRAVVAGESIGTTFDAAGWRIRKETMHIGSVRVAGPQHSIATLMRLDSAATLGLHVYRLFVEDDARAIHYATIVEAHHPDYLQEADLHELYARDVSTVFESTEIAAIEKLVLN